MVADDADQTDETSAAQGFAFTAWALAVLLVGAIVTQVFRIGPSTAAVWPITWRVFVNVAHHDYPVAYQYFPGDGSFVRLTKPMVDSDYLWGVRRTGNADVVRLFSTVGAIPPDTWRDCTAPEVTDCTAVVATAPRTTIPSRFDGVCGTVVVAVERPQDWAAGSTRQIVRVAVLSLTCGG